MTMLTTLVLLAPLAQADPVVECASSVLSNVAPAPGAVDVPVDIEAWFQFDVDCGGVDWTLEIVNADTDEVAATRQINDTYDSDSFGDSFSLKPDAALDPDQSYLLRATPTSGDGIFSETAFETGSGTLQGVDQDPTMVEIVDAFSYEDREGTVHLVATAAPADDPDGMSRIYFETPGHSGEQRGHQIVADQQTIELISSFTDTQTPAEICVVAVQIDGLGGERSSEELCAEVELIESKGLCSAVPLRAGLFALIASMLGVLRRRT